MRLPGKRLYTVLLLLLSPFVFGQETIIGKVLIMGWEFTGDDTAEQTNMAVDAMINYAEAAKKQIHSEEQDPPGKIELYRVHRDELFEGGYIEIPKAFVYASSTMYDAVEESPGIYAFILDEYFSINIQIDFYMNDGPQTSKYKLVFYYDNHDWLKNNKGGNKYELLAVNDEAYDFFVSGISKYRK